MVSSMSESLLAFHRAADGLNLAKNRRGHTNEYLDLDKSMEQLRPLLAEAGLFVRHYTGWEEGPGWYAGTIIEHRSGESRDSGRFPIAGKTDAQGYGSGLTYARRYTLMAVLGLVADNDDDGAGKTQRGTKPTSPGKITPADRSKLMAAIRAAKLPTDRAQEIVREVAGVDKSEDIPKAKLQEVIDAIKAAA